MAGNSRAYFVGPDDDPDKYRLRRQVGGGGEAELWEADMAFAGDREQVAVKILRPQHVADFATWRERWAEQVELLRMIQHPAVVGVHRQFEGPLMHRAEQASSTGRALYLVMNWVDGQDLRDWVPQHTSLEDRSEGLRYLAQIADVIDWLHSGQATPSRRPVVHGDLSPANVVINSDGQSVLVDFGLFRMVRHVTEVPAGTPGYCAPELLQGGQYSPASDLYAFGGLAYYVLTGKHPPVRRGDLDGALRELARSVLQDSVPVSQIAGIFDRDPDRRPSAGEWVRGLRLLTSTAPVLTTPPPSTVSPPSTPPPLPTPPPPPMAPRRQPGGAGARPASPARGLPAGWAIALSAVAVSALLMAIVLGVALSKDRDGEHQQAQRSRASGQAKPGTSSAPSARTPPASGSDDTATSAPTSPTPATPASPTPLVKLQPGTSDLLEGEWTIDGTRYPDSLGCRDCQLGISAVYPTKRKYQRFKGTLATESPYEASLEVTLDGERTVKRMATARHPVTFDIDVSGADEVTITLETQNCCELVIVGRASLE